MDCCRIYPWIRSAAIRSKSAICIGRVSHGIDGDAPISQSLRRTAIPFFRESPIADVEEISDGEETTLRRGRFRKNVGWRGGTHAKGHVPYIRRSIEQRINYAILTVRFERKPFLRHSRNHGGVEKQVASPPLQRRANRNLCVVSE